MTGPTTPPDRRPPLNVRALIATGAVAVPGVPLKVSRALNALDDPDLTSFEVASALNAYLYVAAMPCDRLSGELNDWLTFSVPHERWVLEEAMDALPARHAVHLWRVVSAADDCLLGKTLNDYRADQSEPWWCRRWRP